MSAPFTSRATMFAAAASCMLVAYAFAQPGQPGQTSQPGQAGQIGQQIQPPSQAPSPTNQRAVSNESSQQRPGDANQEVEQFLANCLLIKNQGEVEIAKFAEQRSQNPQVKQFAKTLIEDHQAAIQRIQRIAGAQASAQGQDRSIQQTGYTPPQSGGANQAGGQNAALQQLAAIERQIAERCQQNLREKLQSKQGAEFDHCFVGSQIMGHMQMLAELEVIQSQTSGPLRQIAQESQPKVQHHLQTAEQLAEQLMASSTRQGAQDASR